MKKTSKRRPDFFIVGAPKCGTTALYTYLKSHPEIFLPERKEFNYFCKDLNFNNTANLYKYSGINDYLYYFTSWSDENRGGEASVWYLYSKAAPKEIKNFNKNAQIIIMLRNPIDMLFSLYHQFLITGDENLVTFEEALSAENDRKCGQRLPSNDRTSAPIEGLYYLEVARLSAQVQRYFNVFGRENILVIIYDDFAKNTAIVYRNALEFLGVSQEYQPRFDKINANRIIKNNNLWRLLKFGPPHLRAIWRSMLPSPLRGHILRQLNKLNTKTASRPPMSTETRDYLTKILVPEVECLSELLGCDLTHWVNNLDNDEYRIQERDYSASSLL